MGTPDFAKEILEGLLSGPYHIVAVVTQPDRPVGRKRVMTPPPVKEVALQHDIPVYQPEKFGGSEEMTHLMDKIEYDLIVTAAYGQFVPTKFINSAPYRAINVHASLLPKYRGGAPIHYAIWKGEDETGVSIMYMEREMDAGDILAQRTCLIEPSDHVGIMFNKLARIGRELLMTTLKKLFNNEIIAFPQSLEDVTYSPTIKKEEEQLNFTQTAFQVHNHVRAFHPWPSTYTTLGGHRVKILAGEVFDASDAAHPLLLLDTINAATQTPGVIVAHDEDGFIVRCGKGTVYKITQLQESGKKKTTAKDMIQTGRAHQFIGQRFEFIAQ